MTRESKVEFKVLDILARENIPINDGLLLLLRMVIGGYKRKMLLAKMDQQYMIHELTTDLKKELGVSSL
jgi:hypothetical protein